jgi:hypothetical protein
VGLRIEVLRYPDDVAGPLPWFARVWRDRPGDMPLLLGGTGPCATAGKAQALAQTYANARERAVVVQTEAGRWEVV